MTGGGRATSTALVLIALLAGCTAEGSATDDGSVLSSSPAGIGQVALGVSYQDLADRFGATAFPYEFCG